MATFDATAFLTALPTWSPSSSGALAKGMTVKIIGPESSGKSTLADALAAASGIATVYRPPNTVPTDSAGADPSLAAVLSVMSGQEGASAVYINEVASATVTADAQATLQAAYMGGAAAANVLLVGTVQSPTNVPRITAGTQNLLFVLATDNAFDLQNTWMRYLNFGDLGTLDNFTAAIAALPPYTALVLDQTTPGITNLSQALFTYAAPAPTA